MNIDVDGHLRATTRSMSSLERDGKLAHAVVIGHSYATTIEDLWGALTDAERIPCWFLPVSGELAPGGRYQLEGNAGGVITECEPPTRLGVTWEFGGDVSWIELRLSHDDTGGVRLSLTHTALETEHWHEYGPGAVGVGWELALLGLSMYVEQPTEPKLDEATFATSPAGKTFITCSSEAWRQAAVTGGMNPDAAHAAAKRTTAFYTGEPVDSD